MFQQEFVKVVLTALHWAPISKCHCLSEVDLSPPKFNADKLFKPVAKLHLSLTLNKFVSS